MASTADSISLPRLFDAHCHFRLGNMLGYVLPWTARYCEFGVAMPNTKDDALRNKGAILDAEAVQWYRGLLEARLALMNPRPNFTPIMTIALRDNTTPEMIRKAFAMGARAAKAYPLAVTTNSDEGVRDFFSRNVQDSFKEMARLGMIALFHGELAEDPSIVIDSPAFPIINKSFDNVFAAERLAVRKRELAFLPTFEAIANAHPKLKMVLEHLSTKEAVRLIERSGENVAATITPHHMLLTINDVIGGGSRVHNMCMPAPKEYEDREALIKAAISGNPKFFLGSDTAPHLKGNKECSCGACGVYSAPVLPEVLVQTFEALGRLDRLSDFSSRFGCLFYGLDHSGRQIIMVRKPWQVPDIIDGVVPFMAGKKLQWQIEAGQ